MKKKISLMPLVFPKLLILKDVVKQMSKRFLFRAPFGNQRSNGSQTLLKSSTTAVLSYCFIILRKIQLENVYLSHPEIYGLFVNMLTSYDKCSSHNRENLTLLVPMQLSKKPKTFNRSVIAFLKST